MFRIWKERRLYSNAFLKELELLIEPVRKSQVNDSLPDFKVGEPTSFVTCWIHAACCCCSSQLPVLQDSLSEFAKFEAELKVKSTHLSNLRVDISNPTTSLAMLKGKFDPHLSPSMSSCRPMQTSLLVVEFHKNLRKLVSVCRTIASVWGLR